MNISSQDLKDLGYARALLENPGLAAKITALIGTPIEKGFKLLPEKWSDAVNSGTRTALEKALKFAVLTMDDRTGQASSDKFHKMIVAATGGAGGAFGLPALSVELPISTTVMLRSIADIARSEGEQIKDLDVKLACLEVFALGGRSNRDDAAETGYFAVRSALSSALSEAAQHIAEKGLTRKGAPAIIRYISQIASRFGVNVSEKMAAQALPVFGAAGGALINTLFLDHFQDMARGHFIVRRLERTYGPEAVKAVYEKL
ncbi:MAG: EcsC family protein [Deltaproteobacteria bacterium]|nr:EcsC family protein [Deltaproteobacteria bacterium]